MRSQVGKWHLGMVSEAYLPQSRGFDRFFGYYNGVQDYWGHFNDEAFGVWGASLHRDDTPVYTSTGTYSSELFLSAAKGYIADFAKNASAATSAELRAASGSKGWSHRTTRPLFMYFALQSIHSANNKYLQAPQAALDAYGAISPTFCGPYDLPDSAPGQGAGPRCAVPKVRRRTVAAMVSALDDAVGGLRGALEDHGLWNDTLLVFTTDNGGPVDGFNANEASNWPLRGGKANYFEGGVRGVGLVHGARLSHLAGTAFGGLFSCVDWLPTLLSFAASAVAEGAAPAVGGASGRSAAFDLQAAFAESGDPPWLAGDGVDLWGALSAGKASPRSELLLAAQAPGSPLNHHALIVGKHKLLIEDQFYPAFGFCEDQGSSVFSPRCGWYEPPGDDWNASAHGPWSKPHNLTVKCPAPPKTVADWCRSARPCLFDLDADPCEMDNIAESQPLLLQYMRARLAWYANSSVLPHYLERTNITNNDPRASPANFNYSWMPWVGEDEPLLDPNALVEGVHAVVGASATQ